MSFEKLCKATGLTLAIMGLSSVHSFATGGRAIATNPSASIEEISLLSSERYSSSAPLADNQENNKATLTQLLASYIAAPVAPATE